MTHHLSAHSTRAAGAKLAIAVIAGALAVPAVAGAAPIDLSTTPPVTSGPTEPAGPAPGVSDFNGANEQANQGGATPANINVALSAQGHKAAPADTTVVLRRDGSKADPFVASIGGTPSSASGDDFAWGDAAIGAGAALGLVALAGGAGMALRRRGLYPPQSVPTGS